MRRLPSFVVAATTLLLLLAGCTGGSDAGTPDGGSSDAAPSTTAPEEPAADRDEAGAVAFAGYVFEVVGYAYATVDPAPLEQIADLDQCFGCQQPLGDVAAAAASGESLDALAPVGTSDAMVVDDSGDRATVQLTVRYPDREAPTQVTMDWDGSSWTLVDFAPVGN